MKEFTPLEIDRLKAVILYYAAKGGEGWNCICALLEALGYDPDKVMKGATNA